MTNKRVSRLIITFVVLFALVAAIYTVFYGTFWGRASAEKQLMRSLNQKYGHEKFHQIGYAHYDFVTSEYGVEIVFDRLPHFQYWFALQNGKTVLSATNGTYKGENPPDPPLKLSSFPNTKIVGTIEDTWIGSPNINEDYDRWYIITPQKVDKIGAKYTNISGDNPPSTSGVWSDVLLKGAILYKIPNASPTQKLAVLWKGQYVEALRVNHYSQ
ncbi:hypothetical protein [Alicyclobacillus fastidiosus]|uniref:Uncharacterized protein n=1 Tax=Alicyclobacillus fastidiosus TaxID=392011 RepID=A0ABV5AIT0_9BACL|nr:hypothetical protein [Alicyclobacillus fastidiosus]WEH07778.1 hypothetical protein PYS47_13475 [Alicyclobacillus fastidiosus]